MALKGDAHSKILLHQVLYVQLELNLFYENSPFQHGGAKITSSIMILRERLKKEKEENKLWLSSAKLSKT